MIVNLSFVDALLAKDVRNNSAWNHRWFILEGTGAFNRSEGVQEEIENALRLLKVDPNNNSATAFIVALLEHVMDRCRGRNMKGESCDVKGPPPATAAALPPATAAALLPVLLKKTIQSVNKLVEIGTGDTSSGKGAMAAGSHGLLVDVLEMVGTQNARQRAIHLCDKLREELDPVRARYWSVRQRELKSMDGEALEDLGETLEDLGEALEDLGLTIDAGDSTAVSDAKVESIATKAAANAAATSL